MRKKSPQDKAWETRRREYKWRHDVGERNSQDKVDRELAARSLLRKWRAECGRDIDRCVVCKESMPNTLDTHHLDGDRKNNDPENLVTLCGSCHRIFDKAKSVDDALRDLGYRHKNESAC